MLQDADQVWQAVQKNRRIAVEDRALFQISCSHAVAECVAAVELLAEAAGTSANHLGSPIERAQRDVRVVRQHVTVAPYHIEDGGRVLLGLEPDGNMLAGLR